ncbi:hypothetical protein ADM96_15690 [Burkholderia sp. ST111]|nr:hypothetical protein ADM96_15690 [Burkholderia sp. ST111]
MSADSHGGRDATNSGSDTKKHYGGNLMDKFRNSSAGGAAPSQNDPHVLRTPKTPTSNGIIKNK